MATSYTNIKRPLSEQWIFRRLAIWCRDPETLYAEYHVIDDVSLICWLPDAKTVRVWLSLFFNLDTITVLIIMAHMTR